MKAILISIKPKYVADILNGRQTIEIRKTMPKCDLPIDVYIYCTKETNYKDEFYLNFQKANGKVVAKFTLKKVEEIRPKVKLGLLNTYNTYETETLVINPLLDKCCLSYEELDLYLKWKIGYAWHISNLEIFDRPKELSEFSIKVFPNRKDNLMTRYLTKAPQSWCYIESEELEDEKEN